MKNILRKTLLSTILLTTLGWTADITSWKSNYDSNSDVWIELKDKPGNAQDWIGIYKAGSDNSWSNVIKWRWAKDTTPTQVDKGDWYKFHLDDGKYEARFFLNNSFTVEESISFSVGEQNNEPSIKLSKSIYQENEKLSINLDNLPSNNGDWVGVYAKGASNDWGNVIRWSYTNGTKSMNKDGIEKGTLTLDGLESGAYEARLFYNNTFELVKKVGFSVEQNNNNSVTIGAREVQSTPVNKGTLFASPNGHGDCLSKESACDIYTAFSKLKAGSVLFLRGGEYPLVKTLNVIHSGTKVKPILIESYPGEIVTLNGNESAESILENKNVVRHGIKITGNYVSIRRLEIKNMGAKGIVMLYNSHNLIEGNKIHHNFGGGVVVYAGKDGDNDGPYTLGYNIIRDNIIYNNSDADLGGSMKASCYSYDAYLIQRIQEGDYTVIYSYRWGDNADGISISSGTHNQVIHNTVYENSDDGIDTWRSNDTEVSFNSSYKNGTGRCGNGNGIKTGGNNKVENPKNGLRAVVKHNFSYFNNSNGFDYNSGRNVTFAFNTSFGNKAHGFTTADDTITHHNIALGNKDKTIHKAEHTDNSWSKDIAVEFISTNPNSKNFLRPKVGFGFENMGAYAK